MAVETLTVKKNLTIDIDDMDDESADGSHAYDFFHEKAFRAYCQKISRYPFLTVEEESTITLAIVNERALIAKIKNEEALEKAMERYHH